MIAMQRVATLRDPASFGGWLAAIARNRATDHLRRMPPTKELTDELVNDEPGVFRPSRNGGACLKRPRLRCLATDRLRERRRVLTRALQEGAWDS